MFRLSLIGVAPALRNVRGLLHAEVLGHVDDDGAALNHARLRLRGMNRWLMYELDELLGAVDSAAAPHRLAPTPRSSGTTVGWMAGRSRPICC